MPYRDLYSIANRLKLKSTTPIPRTTNQPPGDYKVGDSSIFYISDILAKRYYTITATVKQVTDHAYWYVQNEQPLNQDALAQAASTFESKIYPTDRSLFGSEWTPGVDNDPRITVLFAPIPGAGGYYASADEYVRAINPYSNQREIIYINIGGGWEGIDTTLAHEFQHMIHWYERPNHDVWLNEGASVLASELNGYGVLGVDNNFMRDPGVQLNAWQASPDASRRNYGAAFLFLDFLRNNYGGNAMLRTLVSSPGQGDDAVDNALASLGYKERFKDVFEQWTIANLVDGETGAAQQGLDYPDRQVKVSPQFSISTYPNSQTQQVSQFGANYVQLSPPGDGSDTVRVDFRGQQETRVISAPPHSGSSLWWSNRGDMADPTMTRPFDLSGVTRATLDFYAWFNVEEDLDYGYVEASSDGGATWDTLKGRYTTATNPNGQNFGNGYTGDSSDRQGADQNGWLHEQIDLTPYAGKQIMLRFEYITDDGYNIQGMAVDDISIPEIGYKDDAESDTGWQAQGFVRVTDQLPQRYWLAAVKFKTSGGFDVQPVQVGPSGEASLDITGLGRQGPYNKVVLIIAGLTPDNILKPGYVLNVTAVK